MATAAASAVAALPGGAGAALAAIANEVHGDSGAISDIADNWQQSADQGTQQTNTVNKAVAQVTDSWTGTAAESFSGLMQRFAAASRTVHENLLVGSKALSQASSTIKAAENNIDAICERVVSSVNQVMALANANKATPAQVQSAISAIVGPAESEARAQANAANTALEQVSDTLGKALQAMGDGTFSSLPVPGTGGVTLASSGGGPSLTSAGTAGAGGGGGSAMSGGGSAMSGGGSAMSGGGAATSSGGAALSGGGGGGTPAAPAQVDDWIQEAMKVLEAHGVPASELNAQDIWIIIQHESSGNPDAINLTDSNAAAGDPSQGLMQTIPSTFESYALPGYNSSITNPVDNIIAGVRYAISRYGSLSNVPGVVAVHNGEPYVGY